MSDILGLINLQCPNTMKELNAKRPLASEPFGAKFRLMDFAMSNRSEEHTSELQSR